MHPWRQKNPPDYFSPSNIKISRAEIPEILERIDNGEKPADLAKEYSVSVRTIYHLKYRYRG